MFLDRAGATEGFFTKMLQTGYCRFQFPIAEGNLAKRSYHNVKKSSIQLE